MKYCLVKMVRSLIESQTSSGREKYTEKHHTKCTQHVRWTQPTKPASEAALNFIPLSISIGVGFTCHSSHHKQLLRNCDLSLLLLKVMVIDVFLMDIHRLLQNDLSHRKPELIVTLVCDPVPFNIFYSRLDTMVRIRMCLDVTDSVSP